MTSEQPGGERNWARGIGTLFLCTLLLSPCSNVRANSALFGIWPALSVEELDVQRGGFVTDGGMTISFGIEHMVLIDGALQVAGSLSLTQLGGTAGGSINLIQSGPGNAFNVSSLPTGIATIVQNTLDQLTIQNLTVINATVSNLDSARIGQLVGSLNQQLVRSLR